MDHFGVWQKGKELEELGLHEILWSSSQFPQLATADIFILFVLLDKPFKFCINLKN